MIQAIGWRKLARARLGRLLALGTIAAWLPAPTLAQVIPGLPGDHAGSEAGGTLAGGRHSRFVHKNEALLEVG